MTRGESDSAASGVGEGLSRRGFMVASGVGGMLWAGPAVALQKAASVVDGIQGYSIFTAEALADLIASARVEAETKGFAPRPLTKATPEFAVRSLVGASKHHRGPFFEAHDTIDHVYYVLSGTHQFLLGGKLKDPREVEPGHWVADACEGYDTVDAKAGDLVMAPRGLVRSGYTADVASILVIATGLPK